MIKETDASKNDERRVKNKLNPLTHKKKGETHTMGNQGMKNWKLGTFFVVSLMLMVGLFSNVALAHDVDDNDEATTDDSGVSTGKVSVSPSSAFSDTILGMLKIRYEATDGNLAVRDIDDDNGTDGTDATFGRIRVQLPPGWGPTLIGDIYLTETAADMVDDDAAADADPSTYLSITGSPGAKHREVDDGGTLVMVEDHDDDEDTDPVAVTRLIDPVLSVGGNRGTAGDPSGGYYIDIDVDNMRKGHHVLLTIHNLRVENISVGTAEATASRSISVSSDSRDGRGARNGAPVHFFVPARVIQVGYPSAGRVTVTPDEVSAGSVVPLFKVKYQATTTLAEVDDDFEDTTGDDSKFGRIQIQLPANWGPDVEADFHLDRQSGKATYLTRSSRGVSFATEDSADPDDDDGDPVFSVSGSLIDGWMIDVDVTDMKSSDHFTVTIHNLKVSKLGVERDDRDMDIDDDDLASKKYRQVTVYSGSYPDEERDAPVMPPKSFDPDEVTAAKGGSDVQPTITVNRKSQGKLTVAPEKVTAGAEENFKITYEVDELVEAG